MEAVKPKSPNCTELTRKEILRENAAHHFPKRPRKSFWIPPPCFGASWPVGVAAGGLVPVLARAGGLAMADWLDRSSHRLIGVDDL